MPILFIIVPFVVLGLAFFYLWRRLVRPAGLPPVWERRARTGLVIWWLAVYASFFITRVGSAWTVPFSWVAYISLGLLSFLFFLLVVRDLLWLIGWIVGKISPAGSGRAGTPSATMPRSMSATTSTAPHAEAPAHDRSRRAHLLQLSSLGIMGVASGLTGYGIFEARRRPGIVNITVPIPRLPKEFVGFRIVQITDIHAGLTVGRDWIDRVAREVAALKPDLIAFTGDVADGSVDHLRDAVEPLGRLRAPHGTYFITGNHEYYSGAEEWVAHMRELGYDVLMNEHRLLERGGARVILGGVTDYSAETVLPSHKSDPAAAFAGAPEGLVRIFLAHQPKTLRQTDDIHFDLMLAGHTHGGQFFPWNLATTLDQPYLSGLHDHGGKWVYVSKGTGYWGPPVRLGARSEITVVTLSDGGAA